ncbi:hypothetical protein C8T65DRAFT_635688 [Cerioporus squamosus]|nr:hypothetical protein C8T65DRAFT_635688 [Cerioporus squamosus]
MASSQSAGRASGLSAGSSAPGSPPARSKSPTMPSLSPPPSPRPRPAAARAHTYASVNTLTANTLNVPSTPFYTPQVSSVNVATVQKRLLMPTVRSPRPSGTSPPRTVQGWVFSVNVSIDGVERTAAGASDWLVGGERFEVVEEQLELEGFQIYAVEKCPQSSLSPNEAQSAWDDAIRNLRRDGARPKETEKGILMVTSLANFRSDYTIVHIPSGNFWTFVSSCTPIDATKDRFIGMYHVTDKAPSRSRELFNATVLELVKLIQASLAIFGMFDLSPEERNGLLCDITCEGIQRWVTDIGEPYLHIEPTERVAEPTVIAALFSLILSTRSKLHALGLVVPKDPFIDPAGFVRALATFHSSKSHPHSHSPHILSLPTSPSSQTNSPASASTSPPPLSLSPSVVFLSQPLIESIELQYEKSRQSESYKVHRVLKNKLDDLASDLRTHMAETGGTTATTLSITSDLAAFARCAVTSKDAPQTLRYFWTGRPGFAEKKRREREAVWSDGERERDRDDGEKDRDGERDGASREKDEKDRDKEARSGDEGERPWSGRVQRKMEKWTGFKGKKLSVDFGHIGKAFMPDSQRGPSERSGHSSMVPSVVVSRDPAEEEELLSSGQQSPVSDVPNPLMLGVGSLPYAERSASELSEYDRRVTEFNQKRPHTKTQSRIISWSDARSARGMLHENGSKEHRIGASPLSKADSSSSPAEDASASMDDIEDLERLHRRRLLTSGPERRRSFDDAPDFVDSHILPVERMRIDVELCGQLLVMRRREAHLANVVACLQALASKLAAQNARLHADHENARVLRTEAETLTQETNALAYESAQFLIEDLWHMAAQPRQRVLTLREKVFGTGRRLPQGVRGAHGSFSRVQWMLDGGERLVDRMGRTESEAEEEEELPHLPGLGMDMEDEVDVVEHQNLKPTWLLRFFNYWGGRLGLSRTLEPPKTTAPDAPAKPADSKAQSQNGINEQQPTEQEEYGTTQVGDVGNGTSSAVGLPTDEVRTQLLQRTFTT